MLMFDENSMQGAQGNSTKDFKVLKRKVQTLLDSKMFSFTSQGLQINNTLSPIHAGPSVHVMDEIVENRCQGDYHTDLDEEL